MLYGGEKTLNKKSLRYRKRKKKKAELKHLQCLGEKLRVNKKSWNGIVFQDRECEFIFNYGRVVLTPCGV